MQGQNGSTTALALPQATTVAVTAPTQSVPLIQPQMQQMQLQINPQIQQPIQQQRQPQIHPQIQPQMQPPMPLQRQAHVQHQTVPTSMNQ